MKKFLALSLLISASIYSMEDNQAAIQVGDLINRPSERYSLETEGLPATEFYFEIGSFTKGMRPSDNGTTTTITLHKTGGTIEYVLPNGGQYFIGWDDAFVIEVLPSNLVISNPDASTSSNQ